MNRNKDDFGGLIMIVLVLLAGIIYLAANHPQILLAIIIVLLLTYLLYKWLNPKGYTRHKPDKPYSIQRRMRRGSFILWSFGLATLCGMPRLAIGSDTDVETQLVIQLFCMSVYALIASLTLNQKRLHDLGKSGWWTLIQFIPGVGLLFWLYLAFAKGERGVNKYGLDPRGQLA